MARAPSDVIATSVVPPPISTTMLPTGSPTGSSAPMAAAIASSIKETSPAPAERVASSTASRSTPVMPLGTHRTTRGRRRRRLPIALRMKWRSICSVTSKSVMTPWRSGRVARIEAGVRPIISLACSPTARTLFVSSSTAMTEGSNRTIPSPRTKTTVLAVPRSTARLPPCPPNRPGSNPTPPRSNRSHAS